MRALLLTMLWPAVAAAQSETVEQELRELAIPDDPRPGFHAAAFAQLVGASASGNNATASEGNVAAGGDLRYSGKRCDYVRVGGQARLAVRDETRTSAEQWASFCIPIFIMEFGHHLEWDVRPALLAPLAMRAGVNRRETVSFRWQPLRARLGLLLSAIERGEAKKQGITLTDPIDPDDPRIPSGDGIVFDVNVNVQFLWTPGGTLAARETADALFLGYEKRQLAAWGEERNFTIDLFRGGGVFIDDYSGGRVDTKASSVGVWALKINNLALGAIYTSGGIGIVSGSAGPYVDMENYEREVDITTARAMLALETGGSWLHGHARWTRDIDVAADGYITLDSRLTSGIGFASKKTRVDLGGAIARTEVHVPSTDPTMPGATSVARVTGGGSLAIRHAIDTHLDATLQVDVARSFYAANVTELDFVPRWGTNVFAALQARIGR